MAQLARTIEPPVAFANPCVLLYGREAYLLEIRRWLLERAGFRVFSTSDPGELRHMMVLERPELFLVCHTIADRDLDVLLAAAHTLQPRMRNFILASNNHLRPLGERDHVLSIFDGSKALLAALQADASREPYYS